MERDDGLRVPQGISMWLNLSAMVLYVLVQSFNFSPLSFCLGKFFLVDVGYVVRPGFLPPYQGTGYYLREYGVKSPQNPRELFNLRHSSLRVIVERAFGALKNRFRILYNKPFHPCKTQVKLVLACCILHN